MAGGGDGGTEMISLGGGDEGPDVPGWLETVEEEEEDRSAEVVGQVG